MRKRGRKRGKPQENFTYLLFLLSPDSFSGSPLYSNLSFNETGLSSAASKPSGHSYLSHLQHFMPTFTSSSKPSSAQLLRCQALAPFLCPL